MARGIHLETLLKFFQAFKFDGESILTHGKTESLTAKQIQERCGLKRTTIFRVLRYGLKKGFIGKAGQGRSAKYYLKFDLPITNQKPLGSWGNVILLLWFEQHKDEIEAYGGRLPDWFMELRQALLAADEEEVKRLRLGNVLRIDRKALRNYSMRKIVESDKTAIQHELHPQPLLDESFMEARDRKVLRKLKKTRKTTFS